mgnify:CR=1 FL=1
MRVYCVDDEIIILRLIKLLVKKEDPGFKVSCFNTAEQVLKLIENGATPDLIVTDIKMPEMNGFELANRVFELDPTIKVAYCSAFSSLKTAIESEDTEVNDRQVLPFYVKPIRKDFLSFIDKLLREDAVLKKN